MIQTSHYCGVPTVERSGVHIPYKNSLQQNYMCTITYRLQESNVPHWYNCSSINRVNTQWIQVLDVHKRKIVQAQSSHLLSVFATTGNKVIKTEQCMITCVDTPNACCIVSKRIFRIYQRDEFYFYLFYFGDLSMQLPMT